jgi:hypothetical protein
LFGSTKILGSSAFTRETDHNKRFFLDIGKQMLGTSYILSLGQMLKIALELNIYFWQKLEPKKI